jgi:hypothetical protein
VTKDDNVHPSLLKDVTTEGLLKLLRFELWVDYQTRNKSISKKEVIEKELQLYKNSLELREDFQAMSTYFYPNPVEQVNICCIFRCPHFHQ